MALVVAFFAAVLVRNVRIRKGKAIEIRDAMLKTQEYERKRIAEDLHDEIGPQLSAMKLQLLTLQDRIDGTSKSMVIEVREDLNSVIENLRSTSRNLSAALLERVGLIEGIKEAISLFEKHQGIKMRFQENCNTLHFPANFEISLYRMTLELINNSFKHSNCTEITIKLIKNAGNLSFEYHDNGQNEPLSSEQGGMGLQNIKNRVNFIDGTVINFTSSFETGAHYCFHFPL